MPTSDRRKVRAQFELEVAEQVSEPVPELLTTML